MRWRRLGEFKSREAFWRDVVKGWPRSGLTQAAYCRRRGVSVCSFHAWRRRLGGPRRATKVRPAEFIPVEIHPSPANIEVLLTNGRVLRVPSGWDAEAVGRLAVALEREAC